MVQSDTGRLQKERKELARSYKEKIWEIRRVWRLFVNDLHETDMMYFCSCIFFHYCISTQIVDMLIFFKFNFCFEMFLRVPLMRVPLKD